MRRGPLSVVHLPEDGSDAVRVAYAITKRVGGSVQRNRVRRRLRAVLHELVRDGDGLVPSGVLLVSAGPEVLGRNPEELRNDVQRLLEALDARIARSST